MTRISNPHENDIGPVNQPANGKTVLVAEDDPFISRMYETKLSTSGYAVILAGNGRDAYEQIKGNPPDLAILDINMPELTGFEVIRALREDGITVLPLEHMLVLTNSADPADRRIASELGVDFIVKAEVTPHDVLNIINQKLGLPAV